MKKGPTLFWINPSKYPYHLLRANCTAKSFRFKILQIESPKGLPGSVKKKGKLFVHTFVTKIHASVTLTRGET